MTFIKIKKGLQARWSVTLTLFALPFLIFFILRWLWYEPFVIPSESMVPNLFIHDYILVKKSAYGIKPIIGDGWLWFRQDPQRGDIVVFRYPENREIFFIKRLIGLPGDHVEVQGLNVFINGKKNEIEHVADFENEISNTLTEQSHASYFKEHIDSKTFYVRYEGDYDEESSLDFEKKSFDVPEGSYFVMGDNRFNSYDSRYWGFVKRDLLVGKAKRIWLSCAQTLENAPMICNPLSIRLNRIFKSIN